MHVYASLQDAKNYLRDEGLPWGAGSTNDGLALSMLESVSRHLDWWCRRSRAFGSGFGPRLGTNRYDAQGGCELDLRDDVLSIDSVTLYALTGSSDTSTPVEDDDFYLVDQWGGYDQGPFRKLRLHGAGSITSLPSGLRVISVAGSMGYSDVRRTLTAALADDVSDSATAIPVDALDEFSIGMTIRVDDEQMYVYGTTAGVDPDPDTLTVDRGVNGTTAAAHLEDAAISNYVYDRRVVEATSRVFAKRWVARNAGGDGSDGGGEVGTTWPRESEDTILRREVGDLRLMGEV